MAERLKPPKLKQAIDEQSSATWSLSPLGGVLSDIERLYCAHADLPLAFDEVVGLDAVERGKLMVEICTQALQADRSLGPVIKKIGQPLRDDRQLRQSADVNSRPAMRLVRRGQSVVIRGSQHIDAMDVVPVSKPS